MISAAMNDLIAELRASRDLDAAQIDHAVGALVSTEVTDETKAEFLKALRDKGETAREIAGFVQALLGRAVDPGLDPEALPGPMIDICGTGGDKLELFNISTTTMFVLAAGGACVVKHGNRAITSKCGGADVLEELGIKIELAPVELRRCLELHGLGFVFAPAYHPAFKVIGPVRKALAAQGIPTIFNLLGPLLNPARPPYQLVGIFSPVLLPKYAAAMAVLGRASAWAVHGRGMDELSLTGPSMVHALHNGLIDERTVDPAEYGLATCTIEDLRGGDCRQNAAILTAIIDGTERGAKRDIVLFNAAAGFVITGLAKDLAAGLDLAREQIDSGRALEKLHALQMFSR
ncbi:MAG TPA: anthranilate phosphoribosyltransferase [Chthoniobacter sp.]|nr:anthranilate phosphoribosyltransferase [Chthoniobacter sp.]